MLDHQSRSEAGFQQNGDTGKLIHGLLGWEKLIPESMAMYQAGRNAFRLSAKPAPEARLWMVEGFAGGIQPWWHHIGAYHEDRRAYHTAEPICRWHRENEAYLVNRRPWATVGVVWSQQNTDFYGRDNATELVENPYRGITQALVRGRIPYLPIHADSIARDAADLAVLILPNLAAISDTQCTAIRDFVKHGGALIATGASTLYTEWGDKRKDFALTDLFGRSCLRRSPGIHPVGYRIKPHHLRLTPEWRGRVDGPKAGDEPPAAGLRHPVLQGFEETDILPYGGMLETMRLDDNVTIPLTFIPPFPIYPPETAWMREPKTTIPALILKGKTAYLPADIDRRFAKDNLPDHGNLLANLVRWAAGGRIPLSVSGPGLIDCHLYRQSERLIVHLVNLTNTGTWRPFIDELIPIGPLEVKIQLPDNLRSRAAGLRVAGTSVNLTVRDRWAVFTIPSILDHELVLLS